MHLHASGFLTDTPSLLYVDRFSQRQQAFAAYAVDTLLASIEAYYIKYGILSSFQFFSCLNFQCFMTKIETARCSICHGMVSAMEKLPHHAVFNEIKIFEQILCRILFPFRELQAPMEESEDTRRTWRLLRNNGFTVDFVWLKPERDPEKFLPASRRHDVEAPLSNKENQS